MIVYLEPDAKRQLPGDLIVRWVLRSDLAPVPRTVEMTVQIKDGIEEQLKEGASLWTGVEMLEYRIIKVQRDKPSAVIQGKDQMATFTITALLSSCAQVAFRRDRAVIRERAKIGQLFRECGATAAIADDFTVARFACYVGQVPSFHLAQAMQGECAAIVIRNGRLSIARIQDLLRQQPVERIGQSDTTDLIDSQFLQRHEIPGYQSLDDSGAFVFGDNRVARATLYHPRTDDRVLRNMTRVIVTKRVADSRMAQNIAAGDVVQVGDDRLLVITAAHLSELNDGVNEDSTRLWLGVLSA